MTGQVVVVVVVKDGSVLLVKRRDGVPPWVFPGGKVEHGEDEATAGCRETQEETGVGVTIGERIGSRRHPRTGAEIIYLGGVVASVAVQPADTGVAAVEWVPLGLLHEFIATDRLFEPVAAFLERHAQAAS